MNELVRQMLQLLQSLLDEIRSRPSPYARGKVSAVSAGPPYTVSVDWNGTTLTGLGWPKDSSYTPVVGDVVLMARFGPQLLILRAY